MAGKNPLKNIRLTSVDDLFKTSETLQEESRENVKYIPLSEMRYFKNHPFKVLDDERMLETAESIKEYGVLVPGLVRPCKEGGYEIVSGHRRHRACDLAGLAEMPVIVRELTDDESIIIMVDSNLQRETILPSEKAFAYKMKLEAMKRQGASTDLTCAPLEHMLSGEKSRDIIASQVNESKEQIRRCIRLTELIPSLLDMVDSSVMSFRPAVEVSYLPKEEQGILWDVMSRDECSPSIAQAAKLRKYSQEGRLNEDTVTVIMNDDKPFERKVILREDKLKKFFPPTFTPKQMEDTIVKLLEAWQRKLESEHEPER